MLRSSIHESPTQTHIMMTIIATAFTSVEMASRMNQVNSLLGVEPDEFISMVIVL